jgi:hypothetical protein
LNNGPSLIYLFYTKIAMNYSMGVWGRLASEMSYKIIYLCVKFQINKKQGLIIETHNFILKEYKN